MKPQINPATFILACSLGQTAAGAAAPRVDELELPLSLAECSGPAGLALAETSRGEPTVLLAGTIEGRASHGAGGTQRSTGGSQRSSGGDRRGTCAGPALRQATLHHTILAITLAPFHPPPAAPPAATPAAAPHGQSRRRQLQPTPNRPVAAAPAAVATAAAAAGGEAEPPQQEDKAGDGGGLAVVRCRALDAPEGLGPLSHLVALPPHTGVGSGGRGGDSGGLAAAAWALGVCVWDYEAGTRLMCLLAPWSPSPAHTCACIALLPSGPKPTP